MQSHNYSDLPKCGKARAFDRSRFSGEGTFICVSAASLPQGSQAVSFHKRERERERVCVCLCVFSQFEEREQKGNIFSFLIYLRSRERRGWRGVVISWILTSHQPHRVISGRITHTKFLYTSSKHVAKSQVCPVHCQNAKKQPSIYLSCL